MFEPLENPFGPKCHPCPRAGPLKTGGAGRIRTADTQFRKLLLYPSELQPHITSHCSTWVWGFCFRHHRHSLQSLQILNFLARFCAPSSCRPRCGSPRVRAIGTMNCRRVDAITKSLLPRTGFPNACQNVPQIESDTLIETEVLASEASAA